MKSKMMQGLMPPAPKWHSWRISLSPDNKLRLSLLNFWGMRVESARFSLTVKYDDYYCGLSRDTHQEGEPRPPEFLAQIIARRAADMVGRLEALSLEKKRQRQLDKLANQFIGSLR